MKLGKYGSRKFTIMWLAMVLFILLPVWYAQSKVSESVQLMVLGCFAWTIFSYNIANVLEKKITGTDNE